LNTFAFACDLIYDVAREREEEGGTAKHTQHELMEIH
jgi:hypothetical protein